MHPQGTEKKLKIWENSKIPKIFKIFGIFEFPEIFNFFLCLVGAHTYFIMCPTFSLCKIYLTPQHISVSWKNIENSLFWTILIFGEKHQKSVKNGLFWPFLTQKRIFGLICGFNFKIQMALKSRIFNIFSWDRNML